jgi:hypothetical protein
MARTNPTTKAKAKAKRKAKPRSSVSTGKKKKMGQPTKLNPKVQESICNALRMGAYVETAVAHAGLSTKTHYEWMKRGANEEARRDAHDKALAEEAEQDAARQRPIQKRVLEKRKARDDEHTSTCIDEQLYVDYRSAVEKAMAEGEMGALGVVAKVAAGGALLSRKTRTDPAGATIVEEKHARPEWTAAAWMLERRHPRRYGQLRRTEISGPEQGPVAMTWVDAVKAAFEGEDPEDDFEGA